MVVHENGFGPIFKILPPLLYVIVRVRI